MPASKYLKILSVRLPEDELRRFKSIAAARGVTVQEAVHEALDAWVSRGRSSAGPIDTFEGSLADTEAGHLPTRTNGK
jgi:hypothetical protein